MRAALVLALVGGLGAAARANPIDAFGFNSRAAAMASAVTAAIDDGGASYHNPAGLVRGRALRIDLGYRYAQPLVRINGADLGVDASRGLAVGLTAPAAIGKFRFAFGVALWLPDQRITRVRSLPFAQPRAVYYDNRMQRFLLSANLAIQIVPGLYIGGGLTFMSRTTGSVSLRGLVAVNDPDQSSLQSSINVDLVAVRYPQAGILWEVNSRLALALTYRHSFNLTLEQAFDIRGDIGSPGQPPIVQNGSLVAGTSSTDMFQPWQLTAGAAARLWRPVLITFDLTFARWSEYPVPATAVDFRLDAGIFNDQVMIPAPRQYPAPRFSDVVIPRVGVEAEVLDGPKLGLLLRGGWSYEPTPVPEQFGEETLADSDKHTFATGLGIELRCLRPVLTRPLDIDFHFAATYLADRYNRRVEPLHPVGDFVTSGVVLSVGLGLRSRF